MNMICKGDRGHFWDKVIKRLWLLSFSLALLTCWLWGSQLPCCESPVGETHVARTWGRPPVHGFCGNESCQPSGGWTWKPSVHTALANTLTAAWEIQTARSVCGDPWPTETVREQLLLCRPLSFGITCYDAISNWCTSPAAVKGNGFLTSPLAGSALLWARRRGQAEEMLVPFPSANGPNSPQRWAESISSVGPSAIDPHVCTSWVCDGVDNKKWTLCQLFVDIMEDGTCRGKGPGSKTGWTCGAVV